MYTYFWPKLYVTEQNFSENHFTGYSVTNVETGSTISLSHTYLISRVHSECIGNLLQC